jgi:predicted nucleotidyltransferase
MDPLIIKNRQKILALAKKNGVTNIRVFGSMAKNQVNQNSDVDFLVEIEKGKSGFALGGFLIDVSELLHRKIDVVTENALHKRIHDKIIQEAVSI